MKPAGPRIGASISSSSSSHSGGRQVGHGQDDWLHGAIIAAELPTLQIELPQRIVVPGELVNILLAERWTWSRRTRLG
jgi:hypothetical protein